MVGDTLIAVLLLLIDTAIFVAGRVSPDVRPDPSPPAYLVFAVNIAMVAPLVLRRKYPLLVAYAVLLLGGVHAALELGLASAIASGIAIYSVVVYVGRKSGAIYLALMIVATVVQLFVQHREDWLVNTVVGVLLMAFCWVLGEFVGARRAYHAEVEARLHLLETERDQASRIAVAAERSRIARELHDVVAHAVSVIVVQADGASYAIRSDPGVAERALRTISETGRDALAELRRLLDVLRGESESESEEPRVPQPTAADLAELAERMRAAGLVVRLTVDADLTTLPTGVSLAVYRIVQESLTNALKHAGTGAHAEARVWREGDDLRVCVTDDAAGRARQLTPTPRSVPEEGGNGLIGMRERANVYGGTLDAGPAPGGGWRVRARFPARWQR